jgi:uncharacterized repeat protein (TIGR03806 family)
VEQTTSEEPFPRKLSQTGLFESVLELKPNAGAIPYSINVPLWSDGADKEHFLALPTMNSVTFSDDGHWQFPVGTVFVKTFHMKTADRRPETRRRLETRLLVHNARGWVGYTYRWNEQQTDAVLLAGVVVTTIETNSHTVANNVSWYFPSRSDCMACHTRSSGFVLGVNTRQMNRTGDIGTARENQLVAMARMNIFREPPSKPPDQLPAWHDWKSQSGTLEQRARAYLDVNCAMCHTPPGYTKVDLRFQTRLDKMMLVGNQPEKPRVGPADSLLIAPGQPERSELFLRINRRGPGQMPNLATSLVDAQAQTVIANWIRSLKK